MGTERIVDLKTLDRTPRALFVRLVAPFEGPLAARGDLARRARGHRAD